MLKKKKIRIIMDKKEVNESNNGEMKIRKRKKRKRLLTTKPTKII